MKGITLQNRDLVEILTKLDPDALLEFQVPANAAEGEKFEVHEAHQTNNWKGVWIVLS